MFTSAAETKIATIWKSLTFSPGRKQAESKQAVQQDMSNRSCHGRRRSHDMIVGEGQLEMQHSDASMTVKHDEELSAASSDGSATIRLLLETLLMDTRRRTTRGLLSFHRSARNVTFHPASLSLLHQSSECVAMWTQRGRCCSASVHQPSRSSALSSALLQEDVEE